MRGRTDSTARWASTPRPRHACSISTDQPPRVALVARTAVLDLAARLGVHHNDVESSNIDGHSDAALWWRFLKSLPRPNSHTPTPRGVMGRGMRRETWRDYWSVEGARGAGFELQNARGAVLSRNLHAILRTESYMRAGLRCQLQDLSSPRVGTRCCAATTKTAPALAPLRPVRRFGPPPKRAYTSRARASNARVGCTGHGSERNSGAPDRQSPVCGPWRLRERVPRREICGDARHGAERAVCGARGREARRRGCWRCD